MLQRPLIALLILSLLALGACGVEEDTSPDPTEQGQEQNNQDGEATPEEDQGAQDDTDPSPEPEPEPDPEDEPTPDPEPEPEEEDEPEDEPTSQPEDEVEPEPEPTSQPEDEVEEETQSDRILALAMEEGVIFLDVRTAGEFEGGHIPGAINLPIDEIQDAMQVLGSDLTQPVIVYCASGNRSARALAALQEAGYQRVVDGGGVLSLAALLEVELER